MIQLFLEFIFGSLLIWFAISSKLKEIVSLLKIWLPAKIIKTLSLIVSIISILIGFEVIIDPIIPGQATIHIHAPDDSILKEKNILIEHLSVIIAPLKVNGQIDPKRRYTGAFATFERTWTKTVNFKFLETRLSVRVLDDSRSGPPVFVDDVRIHSFVRKGLIDKHIRILEKYQIKKFFKGG